MRRVDVGGIRLAVAEQGSGDPVVLLHGFPELSYSWRHQLPALAAAGYRALAPDLRGYGGSDRPSEVGDYAMPHLVADIQGLIDILGGVPVHLVGHDWGGSIAWSLATRSPERVRSLTILNAPHPVASAEGRQLAEQRRRSWYMLLFQFTGVAEAWLSADDFANLRESFFGTAAAGVLGGDEQEAYVAALRPDGAVTAALNYYRANIPPASWLRPPPDLPPVTVPTMIVWGEADAYMTPALLELSAAKIAAPLRIERLPGVSHWVQQEAVEEVNRLLLDYFASH